jgi:DNA-binding transcriptional MerR regulator
MITETKTRAATLDSERDAPLPQFLRIGGVASQAGVTVEALRYYEQLGLLRPVGRRRAGYREYSADAPRAVLFIKRAQSLGFTLAEIADLVRLRDAAWAGTATHALRDATVAKIEDIDRRLRDLHALRDELADRLAACDAACPADQGTARRIDDDSAQRVVALPPTDCPLVQALETGPERQHRPPKLGRRVGPEGHAPAPTSPRSNRRTP